MLKARSGHIRLKKAKYNDLEPVFPELFAKFLEITGQDLEENEEVNSMLLQVNMKDLGKNKKPEGFNRQRSIRLIFPVSKKVEFYIYSDGKTMEVTKAVEVVSQMLNDANLEHTVSWDEMFTDELKARKALASK